MWLEAKYNDTTQAVAPYIGVVPFYKRNRLQKQGTKIKEMGYKNKIATKERKVTKSYSPLFF